MNKKELRQEYLKMRQELDLKYLKKANQTITEKLISLMKKAKIKKAGFFLGVNQEVETIKIINFCLDEGIAVYLPYCFPETKTMTFKLIHHLSQDLEKNSKLNVFQPQETCPDLPDANDLDVLFIPIVAFDANLNRIGMGEGYYDRWIQTNSFQHWKVGLAFSVQETKQSFPVEPHDVKMDYCLTETTSLSVFKR